MRLEQIPDHGKSCNGSYRRQCVSQMRVGHNMEDFDKSEFRCKTAARSPERLVQNGDREGELSSIHSQT